MSGHRAVGQLHFLVVLGFTVPLGVIKKKRFVEGGDIGVKTPQSLCCFIRFESFPFCLCVCPRMFVCKVYSEFGFLIFFSGTRLLVLRA